jgi:hypothetical protein
MMTNDKDAPSNLTQPPSMPWQAWIVATILLAMIPIFGPAIASRISLPSVSTSSTLSQSPTQASDSPPTQPMRVEGTWESPEWGLTELTQEGTNVYASYGYSTKNGYRYGHIQGEMIGKTLNFKWWESKTADSSYENADLHGDGYFQLSSDSKNLKGEWRYSGENKWKEVWNLARR